MPKGCKGTGKSYVGAQFGMLTVVEEVERKGYNRRFLCDCNCGTTTVKYLANLTQGKSRSCGCVQVERSRVGLEKLIAAKRAKFQVTDEGRLCGGCGTWKPWSGFTIDKRRQSHKSPASTCKRCSRFRILKSSYGITKDEWYWLLEQQGGTCALCKRLPDASKASLAVDHSHQCCGRNRACKGCIRGLLCRPCNTMLGLAELSEQNSSRFADYLVVRPFAKEGDQGARQDKDTVRT